MLISTKEVPIELVRALGIRKRSCLLSLYAGDSPVVHLVGQEWGGGSKSEYRVVHLVTGATSLPICTGTTASTVPTFLLSRGYCVVETGYFQGRTAAPSFFIRDSDLDLWLGLGDVPEGMPGPILMDWLLEKDRADEAGRVRALLEGCHLLNA